VNLLAGRALRRTMYPLSPEELGSQFELERALSLGTLPIVWTSEEPEETLAAYVQLYLKEEIQGEALVRNLPGSARFLPIAARGQAAQSVVDFVLSAGASWWAIEVKTAARVHEKHFAGLRAIAGLPGLERRILVHLGDADARTSDGIEVWRFERFCEALATGK